MSIENHYSEQLELLREHYRKRVSIYGDSAQATQWPSKRAQERRFRILAGIADLSKSKVLDFGCGTGHLFDYLRREAAFEGEYVGIDICPDMIELAQSKFRQCRFEVRDIFKEGLEESFDYIFISGIFNNKVPQNERMMKDTLSCLFERTEKGLAFNALSTYVDFFDQDFYYANPDEVFKYCKENLSPLVALRHDYYSKPGTVPFEFTVYVFKSPMKVRINKQVQ